MEEGRRRNTQTSGMSADKKTRRGVELLLFFSKPPNFQSFHIITRKVKRSFEIIDE